MRKRINRNAICSSDDYKRSKRAHINMLKQCHNEFCLMLVNGEISIDVPTENNKFKTIRVFGKSMRVTVDEYNKHCKLLNL